MSRPVRAGAQCRSCRAPIIWARTESTGKRIPLEAAPRQEGTLVIVRAEADGTPVVTIAAPSDPPEFRYLSHFATCPDAGKWRRK